MSVAVTVGDQVVDVKRPVGTLFGNVDVTVPEDVRETAKSKILSKEGQAKSRFAH